MDSITVGVDAIDHESTTPADVVDRVVRDQFIANSLDVETNEKLGIGRHSCNYIEYGLTPVAAPTAV